MQDVYDDINQAAGLLNDIASPARKMRMAMRFMDMMKGGMPFPDAWLPVKPQSKSKAEGQPFVHFDSGFGHVADILLPFDPTGLTVHYTALNDIFSPLGGIVSGGIATQWVRGWVGPSGAIGDPDWQFMASHPSDLGWTYAAAVAPNHFIAIACFTGSRFEGTPNEALSGSVVDATGFGINSGTGRLTATHSHPSAQALPSNAPRNNIEPAFPVGKVWTVPMSIQKQREAYDLVVGTLQITRADPVGVSTPSISVRPKPQPFVRPPAGTREQKYATKSAALFGLARAAFHGISEVADAFDAVFEALPGKYRRGAKNRIDKGMRLWQHWDKVDLTDALVNLIHNHYEDKLLGKYFAQVDAASKRLGIAEYKFDNSITGGPSDGLLEAYGAFSKKYVNPSKEQIKAFLNSLD